MNNGRFSKHREASIFLSEFLHWPRPPISSAITTSKKRIHRVSAKDIHRLFSPAAVPLRLLHGQQAIRLRALQRTLQQAEDRLPLRVGARHVPRDIQLPLPHIIDGVALSVLPQFRRAVVHVAAVVHGILRAELEPCVAADSPACATLAKILFAIHDDLSPCAASGTDRRAAFLFGKIIVHILRKSHARNLLHGR